MSKKRDRLNIKILRLEKGILHLEGDLVTFDDASDVKVIIRNEKKEDHFLDPAPARQSFSVDLDVYSGARYSFFVNRGGKSKKTKPVFGRFSRLTNMENAFFVQDDHLIKSIDGQIRIYDNKFGTRWASGRRLEKTIVREAGRDALRMRKEIWRLKSKARPIWLISDRTDFARDNGAALFKYIMDPENGQRDIRDNVDVYFVLSHDSPDYRELSRLGPVLDPASEEFLIKFVASDLNISSSADGWIINPLGKEHKYYRDLNTSRFVFLQHGVIIHDLSDWLWIFNKNIRLFITSSEAEYRSILDKDYGYDESVVKLTGLARYDLLEDRKKNIVSILPSWRKYVASKVIKGSSDRAYNEDFRNSEFFDFYDRLLNDGRIIETLTEKDYEAVFYLHPSICKQAVDFHAGGPISIWKEGAAPFSKLFSESALLVTDYSSIAGDFAYLNKPTIYTQFDRETFYSEHTLKEGYFDYERDGFGPVCYDYESAVEAIVSSIRQDCCQPKMYADRVDSFFAFRDKENCSRILREIRRL